jgi:hypothetical protein
VFFSPACIDIFLACLAAARGASDGFLGAEACSYRGAANQRPRPPHLHGAIDPQTGLTGMLEVASVDEISTILLLMVIAAAYPHTRLIHVFLDNARYHHAKKVKAWLAEAGCPLCWPTARISTRSSGCGSDAQKRHLQPIPRSFRRLQPRSADLP